MPRPSWLAPPVRAGAADVVRHPALVDQDGNPLPWYPAPLQNLPGTSIQVSGNSARQALYPWPLMPEHQPWTQPDITAQQPHNLRRARNLSPAFARGIPQLIGGGIDWLALLQSLYDEALRHIDDKVNMVQQPFTVGIVPVTVRPSEERRYFFILNQSAAAQNLFVGFDSAPTGAATDFVIPAGSFFEPLKVPQNEIIFLGSAAGTVGTILYANT